MRTERGLMEPTTRSAGSTACSPPDDDDTPNPNTSFVKSPGQLPYESRRMKGPILWLPEAPSTEVVPSTLNSALSVEVVSGASSPTLPLESSVFSTCDVLARPNHTAGASRRVSPAESFGSWARRFHSGEYGPLPSTLNAAVSSPRQVKSPRTLSTEPPSKHHHHHHSPSQANHQQIVLYRAGSMVLYNPLQQRIGARALSAADIRTCESYYQSRCPMCNRAIDFSTYSYEAQSYFRILQDLLRFQFISFHTRRRRSAEGTSSYNCPPGSNSWGLVATPGTIVASPPPASLGHVALQLDSSDASRPSPPVPTYAVTCSAPPKNLPSHMFITGYYANFFREIERLGSGSFGQVYLCHHILDDVYLGEYAVKKIPVGDDKTWLQKMLREVRIRERLHDSNIVEYKHSWLEMYQRSPEQPVIPWLFVLMEFCNGGDLESYLVNSNFLRIGPAPEVLECSVRSRSEGDGSFLSEAALIPETHIWKFFFDIASGLNNLHCSGILHRDLKTQNILIQCGVNSITGRPISTALLADFGTSEHLKDHHKPQCEREGFTGTIEYTAPELLEQDDNGLLRNDYDEKSDVWSLGIVIYSMAFGTLPYACCGDYAGCRTHILGHQSGRDIIPIASTRSYDLHDLIAALLEKEPRERLSLDSALFSRRWARHRDSPAVAEASSEIAMQVEFLRRNKAMGLLGSHVVQDPAAAIRLRREARRKARLTAAAALLPSPRTPKA